MLSKDISLDEKVDALSDDSARLLFTWLIPHLDVEGRMYGEARIFKSIVAPRRNYSIKKVEKYLTEMGNLGLIERYTVDGNRYLLAPNFEKHQTGLRKDKEYQSKIPPKTPDLGRSKDELSPSQVKVKEKFKFNSIHFDIFWKAYPKKKSKGDAEKAFAKVNPNEQLLATMLATIERAKKSEGWLKDNGQFIPYPATWLNHKCWEDEFPEKEGGRDGTHRKSSRQLPPRDGYTRPENIRT